MAYDHKAEELDLYAWNTGELYPARKKVIAEMRRKISDRTYSRWTGWRLWLAWYSDAARRYNREMGEKIHFPRTTIMKVSKERAQIEYDKIKRGEYD